MKRLLFILLVLVCSVSYGQTYQSMPQAGYGPVQRMLFDSVVTLPMGIVRLRNINGGRDTAQIRYNKADSSVYVYTGSRWVKSGGNGSVIDTTSLSNRINSKLSTSDSSIYFTKYRSDTMRTNIYTNMITTGSDASLRNLTITGTNGNGDIHLRHQTSDPTATGQSTTIFADANGDFKWKNDGNYYTTLKTSGNTANRVYTFPDVTTTLLGSGDTVSLSNRINAKQDTSTSWKTGGNYNVNAGQSIGSINNASLRFKTNNTETMVLDSVGKLKLNGFTNNGTYTNSFSLTNTNNRSFFNLNTNSSISQISLKANNDAVGDSMIINDSGLIAPRNNATLWLKPSQSGTFNVVANRCAGCGNGSIFSANAGTSAPVFNVSSTGATSIGASSAAASSLVDMSSTSLGLLIPRMTTTQRNAISSPATGLKVYDLTDSSNYTYDGTRWNRQLSANGLQTITGTSQGGSSANGILDLSQTWNTTGNPTAIKLNVTNTASGASAKLIDLQVGGTSQFNVTKGGVLNASNGGIFGSGSVSAQSFNVTSGLPFNFSNNIVYNSLGTPPVAQITSGNKASYNEGVNFAPTSGTCVYNAMAIGSTINQTGGANGITRGLYIAPTLTSAVDFRGIEVTNGSIAFPYTAQSATYAIKNNDYTINCTANTFTATLPTAVGCTGRIYTIVNSGAGIITIATTSSQTFANVATTPTTLSMATVGTRVVQSNGANWLLISSL